MDLIKKEVVKDFLKRVTAWLTRPFVTTGLVLFQDQLIFPRRKYDDSFGKDEVWTDRLEFTTKDGKQFAYWASPLSSCAGIPDSIWVVSGGNGMLARELDFLVAEVWKRSPSVGILAIEYPGYGENQGRPSVSSIERSSDGAIDALADLLNTNKAELLRRSRCLGISLGAAVALSNAVRWKVPKVIAIAPFTTLSEVAAPFVGNWAGKLIKHRFDNRASVARLSDQDTRILLFHGTEDELIPPSMSRELSLIAPEAVQLREIAGAGHQDIVLRIRNELADTIAAR